MVTYTININIDQSTDVIVKALMDPYNFPYWQTDLERFEVIEGRPGSVGSIGRLHYSQKGKKYVLEDKLIYCEPGRKYISKVTGEALNAQVETVLRPSGNGTEMTIKWSGEAKTFPLRLLLPLMKGKMIKQGQLELEKFKRLIESKGSDFSA